MGPKIPEVEAMRDETGSVTYKSAGRYLPVGGLARVTGVVELRFPFPGSGSGLSGHVFLDGGRVWTPDRRFLPGNDPYDQDRVYFSTGVGAGLETPVGPIRVSVGYKLNPSALDLRDPGDILDQVVREESILDAPTQGWRRFQFHLTVGRAF
jgi:outer membrane protein insertion porin family